MSDIEWKHQMRTLLERPTFPSLTPEQIWNESIDNSIADTSYEQLAEGQNFQKPYAMAVKSGLHLINESLDKSHSISQDIHNETGSYWHGIMHRLEQDFGNAKYWFHRVGHHPVFDSLQLKAAAYLQTDADITSVQNVKIKDGLNKISGQAGWNPYLFVDLVEIQVTGATDSAAQRMLEHIQWFEMVLLLQYSYKQSCGGTLLESN